MRRVIGRFACMDGGVHRQIADGAVKTHIGSFHGDTIRANETGKTSKSSSATTVKEIPPEKRRSRTSRAPRAFAAQRRQASMPSAAWSVSINGTRSIARTTAGAARNIGRRRCLCRRTRQTI
jgi:hypothetical protein